MKNAAYPDRDATIGFSFVSLNKRDKKTKTFLTLTYRRIVSSSERLTHSLYILSTLYQRPKLFCCCHRRLMVEEKEKDEAEEVEKSRVPLPQYCRALFRSNQRNSQNQEIESVFDYLGSHHHHLCFSNR